MSVNQHYGNLLGMLVLYKHHHRVGFFSFILRQIQVTMEKTYMAIGKRGHVDVRS